MTDTLQAIIAEMKASVLHRAEPDVQDWADRLSGLKGGGEPAAMCPHGVPHGTPCNDCVICPNCVHQFPAIPVNVQAALGSAEPVASGTWVTGCTCPVCQKNREAARATEPHPDTRGADAVLDERAAFDNWWCPPGYDPNSAFFSHRAFAWDAWKARAAIKAGGV